MYLWEKMLNIKYVKTLIFFGYVNPQSAGVTPQSKPNFSVNRNYILYTVLMPMYSTKEVVS